MRNCQRPKFIPMSMEKLKKKQEFYDSVKTVLERMRKEWEENPEEFEKKLKEHENGEFAIMLSESGAIKLLMQDMKKENRNGRH